MNRGHEYRSIVAEANGRPELAAYLTERYPHSTVDEWARRIREGRVLVNDRPAGPRARLVDGDSIVWRRPPWREPEVPTGVAVLFRDRDFLGVGKPAGLPTLPGAGYLENTLLELVRRRDPRAAPVHRLGRWTSGLVLFSLTERARAPVAAAWRSGTVLKRYRALASGAPSRDRFVVRVPIGPVPHRLLGTIHAAHPGGRVAETRVRVVERREDAFLADVVIRTGRPHQIRIHLAAAGFPLVGDPLYGPGGVPAPETTALPGDPGYLLHATELRLDHPFERGTLALASRPPQPLTGPREPAFPEDRPCR